MKLDHLTIVICGKVTHCSPLDIPINTEGNPQALKVSHLVYVV